MEKPVCYSHIGKRPNHEDNFLINGLYLTSDEQKKMSDNCCCFVTDDARSKVHLFAISDGMLLDLPDGLHKLCHSFCGKILSLNGNDYAVCRR